MKKFKKAKNVCLLIVSIMVLQLAMPLSFAGAEPLLGEEHSRKNAGEVGEYVETTSGTAINTEKIVFGIQETAKDLENIFKFKSLKLGENEIKDSDIIEIAAGTKLSLEFDWDTVGLNAKSGDYAAILLSNLFKDVKVDNQPIKVSSGEGTITVGLYSINNGELKFVFNEAIENSEVKNGFVGLQLEFNLEKFMKDVEQEIRFNDSKDTTLNVIAKPSSTTTSINKEGHPDSSHDAKEITWTVDVVNGGASEITNAKVTDTLPAGLELQSDSFVITELTIGIDGSKHEGSKITKTPDLVSASNFELSFDEIKPYKGYRIKYTTSITDYTKSTFTNAATFQYGENTLPAKATVSNLTRSNPIEKDGKYSGNDVIEWTIDVNKSGSTINGAKVEDNLPVGLQLVSGSIEVYKITKNGDEWNEGAKLDGYSDVFPVTLGNLTENDAYRIKFKTNIDYLKVNSGNYEKINVFTNNTELKNEENTVVGNAQKDVTVIRSSIIRKTGASNVSYTNKTLTWTIHVNETKHPLTNAVVEDMIPAGLSITKGNIKVYNADGTDITSTLGESDITVASPDADGKTKVTVKLGNINTEYRKIVYTTTITDFKIDTFENSASLTGTGVGGGGTIDPVPVKPPANSFGKTYKGIDYDKKEISWEITANPEREAFKEFKIVDTFPNKGMILLPNSVKVTVGGIVQTKGTDYTLASNTDGVTGYQKGFTIDFIKAGTVNLNNNIVITYKTSYDPQLEVEGNFLDPHLGGTVQDKIYKNQAQFIGKTINGSEINANKDAQTTVRQDSWNSGKKEGQLVHLDESGNKVNGWVSGSERKIAWQIYINYQKQNLGTDVEVTDTLNYTGKIDQNSIKVSVYNVNANGTTSITSNILSDDKYNISFEPDNQKFTLTFKEAVTERYIIEFLTTVPNISKNTYTNNADVKVGNKIYPYSGTVSYNKYNNFLSKGAVELGGNSVYTGDEINWEVKVNESLSVIKKDAKIVDTISKGLVYVNDSLKLYKLTDSGEVLLSAPNDYTLSKSVAEDGKTTLTILFTGDIDYTAVIRYKTVVTETSGKVNNKVEFTGTGIEKKSVESSSLNASQFSWVGGNYDPKKGRLEITKVDSEAELIIENNEAKFTLWYKLNDDYVQFGGNDAVFATVNGVLTIGNLPLRTYYIREAEAPKGYEKLEGEIVIVIDKSYNNNSANIIKKDVENTKTKTSITANKTWVNGPAAKPTIEITLYRQIGNGAKEVVESVTLLNGTTSYTWTNLDKTDMEGNEYQYTADEVNVPANYNKVANGLTVTNTYVSSKINVTGNKVWVGGQTTRPTIKLQLYRDGAKLGDSVELINGETSYTWENLNKTDENGKDYVYSIDEEATPKNYGKSRSDDGLTVTNTYESPKDDIIGRKVWVGGPKLSIQLQLYRQIEGGTKAAVGSPVTLENGIYEYIWASQDKTDKNGNEYTYTVEEIGVPENYINAEDGLTVTNTYVIPKTNITGTKEWVGGSSTRPTIQIQLYRDGTAFGEPVTFESGTTTYTWENLDETDYDGNEYVYTIDEVEVPRRYIKSVSDDGLTIINRYKPSRPTDPVEPSEPEKPVEPEQPVEPEIPEVPVIPTQPEQPVINPNDQLGNILINKLDLDSNPLEGAEFTLYDQSGKAIKTVTSDAKGTVMFNNLPLGLYTVRETKAPDGYELFSDDLLVDLKEAKTLKYNFRNAPEGLEINDPKVPMGWETIDEPDVPIDTINPQLPNTGSLFSTWLLAALGFILILAGLFIKRRNILN